MKQFSYTINDPIGLHARPATMLAKEAKNFEAEIVLFANGKKANAKKNDSDYEYGGKARYGSAYNSGR